MTAAVRSWRWAPVATRPVLLATIVGGGVGLAVAAVYPDARAAIALLPILAGAAVDVRTRRIPNAITAGTLAFALTAALPGALPSALLGGVLAGGVGLGLALAARGGFGAGDVKLMGAAGAALGAAAVPALLLAMGVAGGVLALAMLAFRRSTLHGTMPYGPAIAAGALLALLLTA